jgi:hypothetical protein
MPLGGSLYQAAYVMVTHQAAIFSIPRLRRLDCWLIAYTQPEAWYRSDNLKLIVDRFYEDIQHSDSCVSDRANFAFGPLACGR